jgi:phosphohistidine phosphatase
MRHAKAEPYATDDHVRRLTSKGTAAAADAGRFLASAGVAPDLALVSSSVRTQQTWEQVAAACGGDTRVEVSDELYDATPPVVLEAVRALPDDVWTAVYVGHDPTLTYLAHLLNNGEGDPEVMVGMLKGFPPAAVAVFELPGRWAELDEGQALLTHFHAAGR